METNSSYYTSYLNEEELTGVSTSICVPLLVKEAFVVVKPIQDGNLVDKFTFVAGEKSQSFDGCVRESTHAKIVPPTHVSIST